MAENIPQKVVDANEQDPGLRDPRLARQLVSGKGAALAQGGQGITHPRRLGSCPAGGCKGRIFGNTGYQNNSFIVDIVRYTEQH
jgi:hypothetical protein